MDDAKYSHIVGVFRDRPQAEQAIEALKQAGFGGDQIQLTEYRLHTEEDAQSPSLNESDKRIIVHVKAENREQDAVGILANHGANNADIPSGTRLVHGSIVNGDSETVDLVPEQSADATASDSLFGEGTAQIQAGNISIMDDPNLRRS
ncbi:MAG TPA: hypothetical protein VNE38_04925 [Ktedonobacteraceae bacterium]|nr:hypothetical protein [Ktedonobacteraceae bacterium]